MAWITINILTLCWFKCHLRFAHSDPIGFTEWFKVKYPDRYKKLKELSKQELPPVDHVKVKLYLEQFL